MGVNMVTISNMVKKRLEKEVLIQEAINRNIISYSLLAKYLKPEIEQELDKKIKNSAVVMAIRRHAEKVKKSFSNPSSTYSIETIKTDICYIVLEESPDILHELRDFYSIVDFKRGGILNIIQGNFEVSIITNMRYKEKLLDLLSGKNIIETIDDLVSISLTYSQDFLFMPGILHEVSRFLAWDRINVVDIILTKTELSIVIYKKDLMRCYKTLNHFAEKHKNQIEIVSK
jgi:hypothetical protein